MIEHTVITTSDGLALEAERATPDGAPRAAMVLCHPHPQYGGTMRSIVIGALFDALPQPASRACASTSAASRAARAPTTTGTASSTTCAPRSRPSADLAARRRRAAHARRVVVRRRHGAHHRRRCHRRVARDRAAAADPPRLLGGRRTIRARSCSCSAEHDEFREPASVIEEIAGLDRDRDRGGRRARATSSSVAPTASSRRGAAFVERGGGAGRQTERGARWPCCSRNARSASRRCFARRRGRRRSGARSPSSYACSSSSNGASSASSSSRYRRKNPSSITSLPFAHAHAPSARASSAVRSLRRCRVPATVSRRASVGHGSASERGPRRR